MSARKKLSEAEVKKIRRRLRAGAHLGALAEQAGVNRKTVRRRLDALELAEAERARSKAARQANRRKSLPGPGSPSPERAPARRPKRPAADPASAASRPSPGGPIPRRERPFSYSDWLDERDAGLPAPPDPRVRLVSASGKTVGRTSESNAERMASALEPRHGPLSVLPE
jgi:hypothetical protein